MELVDHTAVVELKVFAKEILKSGRAIHGYKRAMDIYFQRISSHPDAVTVRRISLNPPAPLN